MKGNSSIKRIFTATGVLKTIWLFTQQLFQLIIHTDENTEHCRIFSHDF
jgi:hypothetical protein